jgi:hypothetical protein
MQQVSCSGPTDTRRNGTKFSGHGDPLLGIGTPL